jgi:hypothetical protein
MFVYGDGMAVCSILLSAIGVSEIAKSTNLKGCPHTFVYIVYQLTDSIPGSNQHTTTLQRYLNNYDQGRQRLGKLVSVSFACS